VVEESLLEAASEVPDSYLNLHLLGHVGIMEVELVNARGFDLEDLGQSGEEVAAASPGFPHQQYMAPWDYLQLIKAAEAVDHAP
jgi:hypothetical protein